MNNKSISWHVIEDILELKKMSKQWKRLAENSINNTLFSTPQWILNWYEVYWQKNWKLYVIVGFHNKKLVAMLPTYIQHSTSWPHISTLYPLGQGEPEDEEVLSEYCDILLLPEYLETATTELSEQVAQLKIDQIIWHSVLMSGVIIHILTKLYPVPSTPTNYRYYIERSTWCIKKLSKNTRSRYKRSCNQLSKLDYKFQWVNADKYDIYAQYMIEYHQARWNKKGKLGAFVQPNFQLFHQKIMQVSEQKHVNISALIVNNKPVAINYYLTNGSTLYFYQCGWDEVNYSHLSPGLSLHLWSIENAKQPVYDFMEGELTDSYKGKFGCKQQPMTNIIIAISNWKLMVNKLIVKLKVSNYFKKLLRSINRPKQ
jgi:hypothetical protein